MDEKQKRRRKRKLKEKPKKKTKRTERDEKEKLPKRRRRRRMVSPTLLATNTELKRIISGQENSFEADTEMGMAMHTLEENELKRRTQKSVEEGQDDDEEEEYNEEDDDEEDDDEEGDDDEGENNIDFDELEEPEESPAVTFGNVETTTTGLKSTTIGKLKDIESSRGGNSGLQPDINNEETIKTKVKVKKRNIMFRAERNEFPEFDSEGDTRTTGKRKKKQKESDIPENVDESRKKPKDSEKMEDSDLSNDDLSNDGEVETELKLMKKKKKKMRRIRVKMNRLGTIKDENEEEEDEEKSQQDSTVQKKKKKKCKNRNSDNIEGVESKSDMDENDLEQMTESKSMKCGGGSKKKKKEQSRYRNVKETKKRAFVKNLRVIGRQFNVRPSSSGFYGKDRDWSDRPASRNISQNPIEVFNSAWPKLKKHLFNVRLDPEERNDLVLSRPDVLEQLREKVVELLKTFVARDYPAPSNKGRPNRFNNVWSPGWC